MGRNFTTSNTDRVTFPHDTKYDFTSGDKIVIGIWFRPETNVSNGNLLNLGDFDGVQKRNYDFQYSDGTKKFIDFNYWDTTNQSHAFRQSPVVDYVNLNTWNHMAFEYTFGTGSSADFYHDGSQVANTTWTVGDGNGTPRTQSVNGPQIGSWNFTSAGDGGGFDGDIADIIVFKNPPAGIDIQLIARTRFTPFLFAGLASCILAVRIGSGSPEANWAAAGPHDQGTVLNSTVADSAPVAPMFYSKPTLLGPAAAAAAVSPDAMFSIEMDAVWG